MKLLLTSTGFDNPNVLKAFHKLLSMPAENAKTLFIPTALNTPESRKYVNIFVEDLLKAGISEENIDTYDLDKIFELKKITRYNIVFFCPGSPEFLLERINAVEFHIPLNLFLISGGVYVGVSAGGDVVACNLPNNLGYLDTRLETHAKKGSPNGPVNLTSTDTIKITDTQAVLIVDEKVSVIE